METRNTRQATATGILDLSRVDDPAALAFAFRVLIESPSTQQARGRRDGFDDALREPFLGSGFSAVHRVLFALADEYPNVWVEGRGDYGLRVAHPNHPGGVSLATSRGVDQLEIGRPR